MRRIAHVSDLHFGKFDPAVTEGLFSTLMDLRPHYVVVSGDLTQRAKSDEFTAAKQFLERIAEAGIPYLVIPGNHDIAPLYRPLARLFSPYKEYRKHISDLTEFAIADEEVAIASINTVRRSHLENGRVTRKQIKATQSWFTDLPNDIVKIIVTHHPLYRNPVKKLRTPAWRIGRTMPRLREAGVDIYLSGHLHRASFRRTDALVVQGGTVSERMRGEPQSFNLLTIDKPHLTVETYRWMVRDQKFRAGRASVLLIKNKIAKKDTALRSAPSARHAKHRS